MRTSPPVQRWSSSLPSTLTSTILNAFHSKTVSPQLKSEARPRNPMKFYDRLLFSCLLLGKQSSPTFMRGVFSCQLLLYNVSMNILKQIFSDHYEEIKYALKTRPVVLESIDKMIHCGDPAYGGAMYGCPSCGALKFVPFRCKSRFCPSCGNLYSIQRTTSMSFKIIQCVHRHCVFYPPSGTPYLLPQRSLFAQLSFSFCSRRHSSYVPQTQ